MKGDIIKSQILKKETQKSGYLRIEEDAYQKIKKSTKNPNEISEIHKKWQCSVCSTNCTKYRCTHTGKSILVETP